MKKLLLLFLLAGCVEEKPTAHESFTHYFGKMDYYLGMQDVLIRHKIVLTDEVLKEIEREYAIRSYSQGYKPYPK